MLTELLTIKLLFYWANDGVSGHLILLGLKSRSLPIRGSVLTSALQYVPNIKDNGVQLGNNLDLEILNST